MAVHGVEPDRLQVGHRRAEADGFGDRRRAGFELPRQHVGGVPVTPHVADHAAPAEERGHGIEEVARRPQHADAGRAEHLVARRR